MTPEKAENAVKIMTDNEIIKALECYIKENEFEYFHSNTMCEYPLIRKALGLINRQKAELERLERHTEMYHEVRSEAFKEFAKFLVDKAENGVISIANLPEYVVEMVSDTK